MDMTDISCCVGYLAILTCLFWFLRFVWKLLQCYFLIHLGYVNDLRKYGEWAVVTGATDGIGKEYARQLAQKGFHTCLISRNLLKLEHVAEEIKKEFNVKTKVVVFDFSDCSVYDRLSMEIKELDVGILVNNVGRIYGELEKFADCDMKITSNVLHVNIFSSVHLTNICLKGMVARGRGAIVHVSSAAIYFDIPYYNVYIPTKLFIQKFVRSLQLENNGIIDHQLVIPGYVSTKLLNKKPGFGIPTAKDFVRSAIETIGITDVTTGCFSHEIFGIFAQFTPRFLMTYIMYKFSEAPLKTK